MPEIRKVCIDKTPNVPILVHSVRYQEIYEDLCAQVSKQLIVVAKRTKY
uniref:Uncharacterized protein n=1 Tax=viral metagenome TaxID=1070528 RepID=A0A6C0CC88_9ZZZZ